MMKIIYKNIEYLKESSGYSLISTLNILGIKLSTYKLSRIRNSDFKSSKIKRLYQHLSCTKDILYEEIREGEDVHMYFTWHEYNKLISQVYNYEISQKQATSDILNAFKNLRISKRADFEIKYHKLGFDYKGIDPSLRGLDYTCDIKGSGLELDKKIINSLEEKDFIEYVVNIINDEDLFSDEERMIFISYILFKEKVGHYTYNFTSKNNKKIILKELKDRFAKAMRLFDPYELDIYLSKIFKTI